MKIKPITINLEHEQTLSEKLEVLRLKINEIVNIINKLVLEENNIK